MGGLQAKLAFLLTLAALRGILAGRLRRFAADPACVAPARVGRLRFSALAPVFGIAVLAIGKPHG